MFRLHRAAAALPLRAALPPALPLCSRALLSSPSPLPSPPPPRRWLHLSAPLRRGGHDLPDLPDEQEGGFDEEFGGEEGAEEEKGADRAELREAAAAARALGVGGPMSKAEKLAQRIKRARANKALSEEAKHSKARVEKMKEKARKAAAAKAAAAASDTVLDDVLADDADDAAQEVQLDKNLSKQLNKQLAELLPKAQPDQKKSPAQIAREAEIAKAAKAALLAEQAIVRVNDKITAAQITVIGPDGKKLGTFSRGEALRRAREAGLDLLQVSPGHIKDAPVAAKMLDYKQHKQAAERREREEARARRAVNREMKTVQFKAKIAAGDFATKVAQMRRFLEKGHPVKLTYYGKGEPDPAMFMPLFESAVDKLLLDGSIEPGTLTPTRPYLTFAPVSEKKRATMLPRLTEEQKKQHGVYVDEKTGQWRQRGRRSQEEIDAEEDEEEDDDVEVEANAEPAPPVAAAAATPSPAAAAAPAHPAAVTPASLAAAAAPSLAANGSVTPAAQAQPSKKEKHKKTKPTYITGPALFSRAALQNMQKEAAANKK